MQWISDLQQEPLVPDHSGRVPVDDLREGEFPTITQHDRHAGRLQTHTGSQRESYVPCFDYRTAQREKAHG